MAQGWLVMCGALTPCRKDLAPRVQGMLRVRLLKSWGQWNKKGPRQKQQQERGQAGLLPAPWRARGKGPWGQVQGVTQGELHCPLLLWLKFLWGPLEFRKCMPIGEEGEEGKGTGILLEGEGPLPWSLS